MPQKFIRYPIANSYASLPQDFYTQIEPQPLNSPEVVHINRSLALHIGLSKDFIGSREFLSVVSGRRSLPGGKTIATVYSGHQFGVWAGQLGDGRAHLLGQINTDEGPVELQLKGSGKTPYSRMGDGRAVLRSSVREYLASEAMFHLGIPTTRALSLVVSNDPVYRETVEKAAIVARTSPSFIRFGTFEHFADNPDHLKTLTRYLITTFYPEFVPSVDTKIPDWKSAVLCLLQEISNRTAELVAKWITVGFCHGVMNTDNMSVLGLTIDYGPYGFMDGFKADHICNTTDRGGRYAWNAQASIAYWNLHRLAGSFVGMGLSESELKESLSSFESHFLNSYRSIMSRKFGLEALTPDDYGLIDEWWSLLHNSGADFTLSFRSLADAPHNTDLWVQQFSDVEGAKDWMDSYMARVLYEGRPESERMQEMNSINPLYILRNYLLQDAIDQAESGDYTEVHKLFEVVQNPFEYSKKYKKYAMPPPPGLSSISLSCSS